MSLHFAHRHARSKALFLALALTMASAQATPFRQDAALNVPESGVIGMQDAYLSPSFWIARQPNADSVLLQPTAIAARNARLLKEDASMFALADLPNVLTAKQVKAWIEGLASPPSKPMWDENGKPIAASVLNTIVANRALDAIPATQPTRYGMALHRSALRGFPTDLRAFSRQGETDIDRFQESALFPGDAVVIAHTSQDRQWLFVVSERYAAWTPASAIAEGARSDVLNYAQRTPYRIVTGAKAHTVFTREQPQLSELQLDMGTRVPLAATAPDQPINGQHPYTAWRVTLPIRASDGKLAFAPALLPRIEDSSDAYLPLTRANILRQAFKFLGERYGWGHSYNARDCSGFVSDVYRSMGIQMPRNTSAQAISPTFQRTAFKPGDSRETRMAALAKLDVGDLIYIPGHVMMVIGQMDGQPWVIHDTNGGSYLGSDGAMHSMHLNGVSVTPLLPLRFDASTDYVARITNIVRVTQE